MDYLKIENIYQDPEKRRIEIVERKGIGHPDTLADALAESVSMEYARYCRENFGFILHYNVDKLYIGAGHFKIGYGFCEMLKPVQVSINGRMSNSFNGTSIDLESICQKAIGPYLRSVLPHLKPEQVVINSNSTQYTKIPNWFSPRGKIDLPEYENLKANDTSVCVSHWPMTTSERLAYELEGYFWKMQDGFPVPKFKQFGQDIKVMVSREGKKIDVTVCLPVISTQISSLNDNDIYVQEAENFLNELANEIIAGTEYSVKVKVNPYQRIYMLGIGSCIECGEEGVVGRGNMNSGIISIFRSHSVEAWAGKNPVYHTGRVLGFLTMNLAKAIYAKLGVKCTVIAMTKNSHSLLPPHMLSIEVDQDVPIDKVKEIVNNDFLQVNYLNHLTTDRQIK